MGMNAEERLLENGYEGVKYLTDYSYDSALIGVSHDDRAIYDYDLMVEWLIEEEGFTEEEAVEWIDFNTIRALPYMGADGPLVLHRFLEVLNYADETKGPVQASRLPGARAVRDQIL